MGWAALEFVPLHGIRVKLHGLCYEAVLFISWPFNNSKHSVFPPWHFLVGHLRKLVDYLCPSLQRPKKPAANSSYSTNFNNATIKLLCEEVDCPSNGNSTTATTFQRVWVGVCVAPSAQRFGEVALCGSSPGSSHKSAAAICAFEQAKRCKTSKRVLAIKTLCRTNAKAS